MLFFAGFKACFDGTLYVKTLLQIQLVIATSESEIVKREIFLRKGKIKLAG